MEITIYQIVMIFLVSCISGIESVLDEFQFHRPLISCTLIGLILGNIRYGILIGSTLEMITLGWMNIGAALSADTALASIISTILVIAGNQSIGTGIALAIPLAILGQLLNILIRTFNIFLQHMADRAAENINLNILSWIHVLAIMMQAMRVAIPVLIVSITLKNNFLFDLLRLIPKFIIHGLNIANGIIVIVGYAMVINMIRTNYLMPFFYLGFIIADFSNLNLLAISIIGLIISIIYIQLHPKFFFKEPKNKKIINNKNYLDNELD